MAHRRRDTKIQKKVNVNKNLLTNYFEKENPPPERNSRFLKQQQQQQQATVATVATTATAATATTTTTTTKAATKKSERE
ncbi:hypothetical protein C2G38_2158507 [Gigaspora rosea]|uniref:Uncharacterized protein n=1 Tax=Gigaspora rosea TaxID=44941 RepID=A0A397W2C9_9GLOM|nr:hypothetical protein C2G38_2158507 [Gigaspora rosea]